MMTDLVKRYLKDTSGATAIEYGLIAALVGVGMIGGLKALAGGQNSSWGSMGNKVTSNLN